MSSKEPIKQSSAGSTNVEISGRTRGKTNTNFLTHIIKKYTLGKKHMQMKISTFILILLLVFPTSAGASTLTDSLLRDGIGVRAMGMGGAATALADDPSAVFYNPAGLIYNQSLRIEKGYLDINSKLSKNSEYSVFNYGYLAFSNWARKDLNNEEAAVSAFSYARPAGNNMSWGFSYKNITGAVGNGKNSATSLDIGLLGRLIPSLSWGLVLQDIVDNGDLAGGVRFGLCYKPIPLLNFVGDVEYRNIKSSAGPEVYTHLGVEHYVMDGLALRAGYYRDRWTGGGSFYFHPIIIDYALQASSGVGSQAVQMIGVKVEL